MSTNLLLRLAAWSRFGIKAGNNWIELYEDLNRQIDEYEKEAPGIEPALSRGIEPHREGGTTA